MSSVPIGLLEQRADDTLRRALRGDQQATRTPGAEQITELPAPYLGAATKHGGPRRAEEQAEPS